jgi:hypothetical protein
MSIMLFLSIYLYIVGALISWLIESKFPKSSLITKVMIVLSWPISYPIIIIVTVIVTLIQERQ